MNTKSKKNEATKNKDAHDDQFIGNIHIKGLQISLASYETIHN